jgi:hypothetical protein
MHPTIFATHELKRQARFRCGGGGKPQRLVTCVLILGQGSALMAIIYQPDGWECL